MLSFPSFRNPKHSSLFFIVIKLIYFWGQKTFFLFLFFLCSLSRKRNVEQFFTFCEESFVLRDETTRKTMTKKNPTTKTFTKKKSIWGIRHSRKRENHLKRGFQERQKPDLTDETYKETHDEWLVTFMERWSHLRCLKREKKGRKKTKLIKFVLYGFSRNNIN